ncbi:MAG TPA: ABC transporter substrate-binding protein [Flexilinea sp.]|nr:ABC transporter substrate-binding protein [Flexilinea sp.]HPR71242.1 ABC transporter substrate-binding protein [Flexilinea sp.]
MPGTVTPEKKSVESILTEMAISTQQAITASDTIAPVTEIEEPEPTIYPSKVLNVCLGSEPSSLFIYNNSSKSGWSVLESIYDGPFDTIDGRDVPVIFENVDFVKDEVQAKEGDIVMNSRGEAVALAAGMEVTPANGENVCGSDACTVQWDGVTPLSFYQATITYKIKSGILWSDGETLSAKDSVYSWRLAGDPAIPGSKKMFNLTKSYKATDDQTVVWQGVPGFIPQKASDVFWLPLPEHVMGNMKAADILVDEGINRTPIGWGAYKIAEWNPGDQITVVRNASYRNTETGVALFFDKVVFHFYGKAGDNNLAALKSGSCDIVDTSVDLLPNLEPILEDVRDGKISAYIQPQTVWEQLTLNFAPLNQKGFGYFADVGVRKGIARCLDREALIRQVLYGQSEIPQGFYPSQHSLFAGNLTDTEFDPVAGRALLEDAGWIDSDGDSTTPRVSSGVEGVPDGTEFAVTLETSESTERIKAAELIRDQLADCGISVTVQAEDQAEIYAQGPEGSVFGRKFDMAMFAWASGDQSPCSLYSSSQIPTEENQWIGLNVGGYRSAEYDSACNIAQNASPMEEDYLGKAEKVQQLFAEDLPVIPLYFYPAIGLSGNRICGLKNSIGMRSLLYNIELLTRSDSNCAVSQWKNVYSE